MKDVVVDDQVVTLQIWDTGTDPKPCLVPNTLSPGVAVPAKRTLAFPFLCSGARAVLLSRGGVLSRGGWVRVGLRRDQPKVLREPHQLAKRAASQDRWTQARQASTICSHRCVLCFLPSGRLNPTVMVWHRKQNRLGRAAPRAGGNGDSLVPGPRQRHALRGYCGILVLLTRMHAHS